MQLYQMMRGAVKTRINMKIASLMIRQILLRGAPKPNLVVICWLFTGKFLNVILVPLDPIQSLR